MPVSYPLLRIEIIAFMAVMLKHVRYNRKIHGLATWSAN